MRYHRVPEIGVRAKSLEFVEKGQIPWRVLTPDVQHTWLIPDHADEYSGNLAIDETFSIRTLGLNTNRDGVVYDFNQEKLADRVRKFVLSYNAEVDRHRHDKEAEFADQSNGAAA